MLAQAGCHADQYFVASGVTEGVIHRFEAVQVDVEQCQCRAATKRRQILIQVVAQPAAVGQAGQGIVLREVLNASLRLGFLGDVAGGAAIADQLVVLMDGAGSQPAETLAAIGGTIAAAQWCDLWCLEPVLQRGTVADQQFQQRAAQPLAGFVSGDLPKAIGKEGQPSLRVGFPDPVGSGLGDIAKPLLAFRQRAATGGQPCIADVEQVQAAQGMANEQPGEQPQPQGHGREDWQGNPQQQAPRLRRRPGELDG